MASPTPRFEPDVCELCESIFSDSDQMLRLVKKEPLRFDRRYPSLVEAKAHGCQLCGLLVSIVESPPTALKSGIPSPIEDAHLVQEPDTKALDSIECRVEVEGDSLHELRVTCSSKERRDRFTVVRIAALYYDPAAKHVTGRLVNPRLDCPRTFARVKQWLDKCHSDHELCNECQLHPAKSQVGPTFVINLGSDSNLVFLEAVTPTNPAYRKFAALSYCWGSDQPAATTLSRVEAYTTDGIPISSLPLTVQHAITVCKALEINFIWVDSLCIPQDSPTHMEHELSIMGAIYHNAYVVISAMSAKSCNDGFLYKSSPPSDITSKAIRESLKLPFGKDGEVVVFLDPSSADCDFQVPKFASEPLSKRGWAYQESFLARRILAFTSDEVIWSCRRTGGDSSGAREGFGTQVLFGDCGRMAHVFAGEYRDWGFIIENFSQGLLSKDADKFFALAGVAELFHQQNGGNYVAGLWVEAAKQLLAWFVPHHNDRDPPTRPSIWRAPSWSYMSLDSPGGIRFVSISRWNGFEWKAWFTAKPLSVANPFGGLESASVSFTGQLVPVQVGRLVNPETVNPRLFYLEHRSLSEELSPVLSGCMDIDPSTWWLMIDVIRVSTSGEPDNVCIASCYGNLQLTDRFWWLPMYYINVGELGQRKERVIGWALACMEDGRYHRIGHVTCDGLTGTSLSEQIMNLDMEEFETV